MTGNLGKLFGSLYNLPNFSILINISTIPLHKFNIHGYHRWKICLLGCFDVGGFFLFGEMIRKVCRNRMMRAVLNFKFCWEE